MRPATRRCGSTGSGRTAACRAARGDASSRRQGARTPAATLEDPAKYHHVQLHARDIPWAYANGTVGVRQQQWVAVVVNGTIAAVSQTIPGDAAGQSK